MPVLDRGAMLPRKSRDCSRLSVVRIAVVLGLAWTMAACTPASSVTTTTTTPTTSAADLTVPSPATTRPPRASFAVTFVLSAGRLTLSGSVPDQQARDALISMARATFGEENVTDSLQVGRETASSEMTVAFETLPGIIAQLPSWFDAAELSLRGSDLSVSGDALSAEALEQATNILESTVGLSVTLEIEISPVVSSREQLAALLETETITFVTGSAEINAEGVLVLERVIEILAPVFAARPRVAVRIDGHTDDQGPDDSNRDLSLRRAQAVLDYMVAAGLPAANLSTEGFGESMPVADNGTEEGRAKNRRIEFTLEG